MHWTLFIVCLTIEDGHLSHVMMTSRWRHSTIIILLLREKIRACWDGFPSSSSYNIAQAPSSKVLPIFYGAQAPSKLYWVLASFVFLIFLLTLLMPVDILPSLYEKTRWWHKDWVWCANVREGAQMSRNVRKCPGWCTNVREGAQMSGNVRKCPGRFTNIWDGAQMSGVYVWFFWVSLVNISSISNKLMRALGLKGLFQSCFLTKDFFTNKLYFQHVHGFQFIHYKPEGKETCQEGILSSVIKV